MIRTDMFCSAGLPDVEAEIMEGERDTEYTDGNAAKIQSSPIPYPLIGASIGIGERTGTLGGYIRVDGEVMGVTNHHVIFKDRLEPYPAPGEVIADNPLVVVQPSEVDLKDSVLRTERQLKNPKLSAVQITELNKLEELKASTPQRCRLGTVWKTSGIRASEPDGENHRFRLDWALVKLDNPGRLSEPSRFTNEVCKLCVPSEKPPDLLNRCLVLSSSVLRMTVGILKTQIVMSATRML
jgi:hypothetical protein